MISSRDLSADLLLHAATLLSQRNPVLEQVIARRAVSAAYYSLFHRLTGDAVSLLAPHVSIVTNHRIHRWFDHGEIKRICARFTPETLDQPLRSLIGNSPSPDLQFVARTFVLLQEARHRADYDLSFEPRGNEIWLFLERASKAIQAWERLSKTAEANIFILSLLLWKNWEKDRS